MTEMSKDDANMSAADDMRVKRRRVLKAGAVIAPLAVTLHGGVALAQVTSAGRCVETLKANLQIPQFLEDPDNPGNYIQNGSVAFDPSPAALTGRTIDNGVEDHWNYVLREQIAGQTCLQSFENTGQPRPL